MSHSIRQAMRSYHCYACENNFKQMVNMNDLSSVKCPSCDSDFLEEQKTYAEVQQVMEEANRQSQQSESSFEEEEEEMFSEASHDVFEHMFAPQ